MGDGSVWSRYRAYLERRPQEVVEWRDPESEARGWLVINSLRGGAAGGGTRMRRGLTLEEVVYLAKTMELKFAFAGPPVGGAKSGIDFDARDPRKSGVLGRWFRHVSPYLRECYATGGDLNVDELTEVIPHCQAAGVRHPQEGVVRGHLGPRPSDFDRILGVLDRGIAAPLGDAIGVRGAVLRVSDLVAGYGLARAIVRLVCGVGRELEGARVLLEGFGAVGAGVALELARSGARIVAIADADKTLIEPAGLDAAAIEELIRRRVNRLLPDDGRCVRRSEVRAGIESAGVDAEIFVAAAVSDSIDRARLDALQARGVALIACGANHPFREARLGEVAVQREADRRFSVLADVIGSAGGACTYSYLMREGAVAEARSIMEAVDATIGAAIDEVLERNRERPTGLLEATLDGALDRIEASA